MALSQYKNRSPGWSGFRFSLWPALPTCKVIDNLEKNKLVRRERNEADRRFFIIHLTDKGYNLINKLFPPHAAVIAKDLGVLTAAEQDVLGGVVQKTGPQRGNISFIQEELIMKVLVVFYSTYGHVYKMAQAMAEGAGEVEGAKVEIRRVPETLPHEVLEKMGTVDAQKAFSQIPACKVDELAQADAIIFGTPTRFGNMCGQMRQFLDATGQLWANGSLVGKVGSVFTSTATQHGGQESTILTFHVTLLHHGFIVVGLPYAFQGQMRLDEITGGSPYGASTIAGGDGSRMPSENELEAARYQGKHVAEIASKLAA